MESNNQNKKNDIFIPTNKISTMLKNIINNQKKETETKIVKDLPKKSIMPKEEEIIMKKEENFDFKFTDMQKENEDIQIFIKKVNSSYKKDDELMNYYKNQINNICKTQEIDNIRIKVENYISLKFKDDNVQKLLKQYL